MSFLSRLLRLQFPVRKSTRKRCHSRTCLEQLETRTLLSGWTIAIGNDTNSTIQPRSRNAVDTAGNTYVAGGFSGSFDFDPSAASNILTSNSTTTPDAYDAFAVRYNADGSLQWTRKFGGTDGDGAYAIAFDGTSAVYVGGTFIGSADFTGDGQVDVTSAGNMDSFVVKLNAATGETIWYRTFGGAAADDMRDLAVLNGQVYMTGQFGGTADFDPGTNVFSLTPVGKSRNRPADGFVSRLDANGAFVTAWQMGGTDIDRAYSLQVDAGGVSVLGDFRGTADFQPGSGTLNKTSAGQADVFLAHYSLTGSPDWVQTIGGAGIETAEEWSLATSNDAIYVTGHFNGKLDVDPGTGSYVLDSGDTFLDALMAKYSKTNGAFVWARSYGQLGTSETAGMPAAVDPVTGNIYFGGIFYGTLDFTPQIPGDELVSAGDRDSLLVKLDPQGNFIKAWRCGGQGYDSAARPAGIVGNTVHVVGWIYPGTADFPTGDILVNVTGRDMYVMALNDPAATPSPLLAAAVPARSVDQSLTASQYRPILAEAQRRWQAAGVNTAALSGLNVQVRNLGGTTLGLASGNTIWLDDNAAGWGWFVDSTPGNSSEFLRLGNQGEQQRMDLDLLTVVMHEMGHLLGHNHDVEGVMAETLVAGVRRTDTEHDHMASVDQVFGQAVDHHTEGLLGTLLDDRLNSRGLSFKRRR